MSSHDWSKVNSDDVAPKWNQTVVMGVSFEDSNVNELKKEFAI